MDVPPLLAAFALIVKPNAHGLHALECLITFLENSNAVATSQGQTQHCNHLEKCRLRADRTAGGQRGRPTGTISIICIQVDLNTVMTLCCRTYHHYKLDGGFDLLLATEFPYSIGFRILPVLPQHIRAFFTPALYMNSVPHSCIPAFYQHPVPTGIRKFTTSNSYYLTSTACRATDLFCIL